MCSALTTNILRVICPCLAAIGAVVAASIAVYLASERWKRPKIIIDLKPSISKIRHTIIKRPTPDGKWVERDIENVRYICF